MRDLCQVRAEIGIRMNMEAERKKAEAVLVKLHKFGLSFLEWVMRLTFEEKRIQRYNEGTNRGVRKARK